MTISSSLFFFFNDTATTEIYTLSLHDALPIYQSPTRRHAFRPGCSRNRHVSIERSQQFRVCPALKLLATFRSEEHTSELQSLRHLVCRLLLEKNNNSCVKRATSAHSSRASQL